MNWKTGLQLSDLSAPERIELICNQCGHVSKIHPGDPIIETYGYLYLDELERRARCKGTALKGRSGGCRSSMRLLLCSSADTHAFQAGIA